jgi:hypothetical protein
MRTCALLKPMLFMALFMLAIAAGLGATGRGIVYDPATVEGSLEPGRHFALFIAIDDYLELPPLAHPVSDAKDIQEIITAHYRMDEVIELLDSRATSETLLATLADLSDRLTPEDSLFVFYAGHGFFDRDTADSYWALFDAGKDEKRKANWVAHSRIRQILDQLPCRHVFLVSDSCFSGSFLNLDRGGWASWGSVLSPGGIALASGSGALPSGGSAAASGDSTLASDSDFLLKAFNRRSRLVLTSGALEPVPDRSEFAHAFKLALFRNRSVPVDPLILYNEIRTGMKKTIPLFGNFSDNQGGSYLFLPQTGSRTARSGQGSIRVVARQAATLYLDSIRIAELSKDSVWTIQDVEPGLHSVLVVPEIGHPAEYMVYILGTRTVVVDSRAGIPYRERQTQGAAAVRYGRASPFLNLVLPGVAQKQAGDNSWGNLYLGSSAAALVTLAAGELLFWTGYQQYKDATALADIAAHRDRAESGRMISAAGLATFTALAVVSTVHGLVKKMARPR